MPIFMKERVTLTLDSEILKQIDQSIDGFHIKNRSHAIELLLLPRATIRHSWARYNYGCWKENEWNEEGS